MAKASEVTIKILEPEDEREPRSIRIFGNNAQNVQNARLEVEYVEEAMLVDDDQYNWLSGKGQRSIYHFKACCPKGRLFSVEEVSGLVYARLDYDSSQLLLSLPALFAESRSLEYM